MKKIMMLLLCALGVNGGAIAQKLKRNLVPVVVTAALHNKFPGAGKVTWEKEKGNYEANWGGKSGEDHSAVFTPAGTFVEIVDAIPVSQLPSGVQTYVSSHYKSQITEAGKVTDARGKTTFEAEVKGGDLIFDEQGNFIKRD